MVAFGLKKPVRSDRKSVIFDSSVNNLNRGAVLLAVMGSTTAHDDTANLRHTTQTVEFRANSRT